MLRKPTAVAIAGALIASFANGSAPAVADAPALNPYVGALHEHSGYSDGWPGSTPADYFASAKAFGLDFLASGEHSDSAMVPFVFNEECLGAGLVTCPGGDPDPVKSVTKWDATLAYARAATDETFTGIRGFEWTSDRFGHINVYFSRNDTNAKADGGYAAMETFYRWFETRPELGGGSDGLATFNHPGDKDLADDDPGFNWNDFAYVPEADDRMVGLEVYNDTKEYGTTRGPAGGYYAHVLDKGWHVGPIGAEDLGHDRSDDWGGPGWAKTVILAPDRSEASLRAAMLARRFYAVRTPELRMTFTVDGQQMGARLQRAPGSTLTLEASINDPTATIEVVTSGGAVVASAGGGTLSAELPATVSQRYYFVRALRGTSYVAYSAPVWIQGSAPAAIGEWLAGDLHVHTCYSHDAWCPPDDSNTGPEDFYTLSGSVAERFIEARARGLDYLAITDHHSDGNPGESGAGSWQDPGFGTQGVIGVPGYENSIRGHAQMLGATRVYPGGDQTAASINAMADELRADGGVFQANHPADNAHLLGRPFACDDLGYLHWRYGYDVRVDTIEVWNITSILQPPIPAMTSNEDAIRFWECWLQMGYRVAATGGSDSHWLSTAAVQGPGNPTTWVFARERSAAGVLTALREGRTSVSLLPPVEGAIRLVLEADADGDGTYESMIGDTVPGGTPMRVRLSGAPIAGVLEVRANGTTLFDVPLPPGGEVTFAAPDAPTGWVRATLRLPEAHDERMAACQPLVGASTTYCRNHVTSLALTSPIYLGVPS